MTAPQFPLMMNVPLSAGLNEPRCVWGRKIRKLADGRRTLLDIAHELYLPQQVIARLVTQGLRDGTLNLLEDEPTLILRDLMHLLEHHIGERARDVLDSACRMTCLTPGQVNESTLPDLLIAMELSVSPTQRIGLSGILDGFRRARCA